MKNCYELLIYKNINEKEFIKIIKGTNISYNLPSFSYTLEECQNLKMKLKIENKNQITFFSFEFSDDVLKTQIEFLEKFQEQVAIALNIKRISYLVLNDPISKELAKLAYPKISEFEITLRKFTNLICSIQYNGQWQKKLIPEEKTNEIKSQTGGKIPLDFLVEVDLDYLIRLLFEKNFIKFIKTNDKGDNEIEIIMKSDIEKKLPNSYIEKEEISLLDEFYEIEKTKEDSSFTFENATKIRLFRNKVGHSKQIKYKNYLETIQILEESIIELSAANSKLINNTELTTNDSIRKIGIAAIKSISEALKNVSTPDTAKQMAKQITNLAISTEALKNVSTPNVTKQMAHIKSQQETLEKNNVIDEE